MATVLSPGLGTSACCGCGPKKKKKKGGGGHVNKGKRINLFILMFGNPLNKRYSKAIRYIEHPGFKGRPQIMLKIHLFFILIFFCLSSF